MKRTSHMLSKIAVLALPLSFALILSAQTNPDQIALLRWYAADQAATIPVVSPQLLAFDGSSMWITTNNASVVRVRASDGSVLGTFTGFSVPYGVAYDGAHVWVVDWNINGVKKLNGSDG